MNCPMFDKLALFPMQNSRRRKQRTVFTEKQLSKLDEEFGKNHYLSVTKRNELANSLRLTETQVSNDLVVHNRQFG